MKIRASLVSGYPDCPRRAASKAFRDEITELGASLKPSEASIAPIFGTANHKGVEYSLSYKMKFNSLPNIDDAIDSAITDLVIASTEIEIAWDHQTPNINVAKDQIALTQRIHREYFQNEMKPVAIERAFNLDIGDGFELTGTPDSIDADGTINDLKTGTRDANHLGQMGSYLILAKSNGIDVSKSVLQWLPRPKKDGILIPWEIKNDAKTCVNVARATIKQIKRDVINFQQTKDPWSFAANTSSTLCSEKFCPAYGTDFCEATKTKPTKKEKMI